MREEITAPKKILVAFDVLAASTILGAGVLATASAAGRPGAGIAVESMVSGAGLSCVNLPLEAIFMMGTAAALFTVRGLISTTENIVGFVGRCGCFAKKPDVLIQDDLVSPLAHVDVASGRPSAAAASLDV